ncbi:OmpA family protein [Flavobacterium sp. AJR]|uniref:OmpA family protein n=1 Tax=Flavobacterium sp. AJR TaxID=1979369 RepID=UPI000A3D770C|nr:OmpA family protein [Flavobacterium sp. AJR]OUL62890.1 flagellar motor protein MotB [Flavobacterium sp. AJR]
MSKKTLYLLGIVVTIILGTFLYLKFCCNCCTKEPADDIEKVVVIKETVTEIVPFVINGTGIDYRSSDNLKFLKNSASVITPVKDSVNIGIEKLKTFLDANPEQKVTITGYATTDEKNTTTYPNLGIARANDVKNYFVSKGLSAGKFNTNGEIIDSWKTSGDTLLGPVSFEINTSTDSVATKTDGEDFAALKTKINADPLVLHFNTNKSNNNLNAADRQKIKDISYYILHVNDGALLVVGHSDNVGNRESNVVLSQKRADFTKNYLSKNGIDGSKIETQSKGPDEPVGDNTTADGKANNRRTVVTIK